MKHMQQVMLFKQNPKHVLTGEYKKRHSGSMDATQAAEWEREMMRWVYEPCACEREDEEEINRETWQVSY